MKNNDSKAFFFFSAIHSILTGLFIFYIPLLLWSEFQSFSLLCFFIAIGGISYLGILRIFEKLLKTTPLSLLIQISLWVPLVNFLVFLLFFDSFPLLLAIPYGIYMCFYYMLHRFLFFEITKKHNSGKTFGNFQILVLIFLKISMLGSAFFIEKEQFLILLFLSIIVILYGNFQFSKVLKIIDF